MIRENIIRDFANISSINLSLMSHLVRIARANIVSKSESFYGNFSVKDCGVVKSTSARDGILRDVSYNIDGNFFVAMVYLRDSGEDQIIAIKENGKVISKLRFKCTCDSHHFFWHGCTCMGES